MHSLLRTCRCARVRRPDAEQPLGHFFASFVICRSGNRYPMLSPSPPIPPSMRIPVALWLIRIIGSSGAELAHLANLVRRAALSRHG